MRHENHGLPLLLREPRQQIEDERGVFHVEISGRLIGEENSGLVGEGTGDGDALLLAAGKLRAQTMRLRAQPPRIEQAVAGGTSGGSTAITGWTVTGSDVDRVQSTGWQAADGSFSLDMNGFHPGGVTQNIATVVGEQYTVGFSLSKNPGNLTHATLQVTAAGATQDYDFSLGNSATDMKWSQQTFSFVATGSSTTLALKSIYPTDATGAFPINAQGPALDEVVVASNKVINNFTLAVVTKEQNR